jgi:hypothetical protein
VPDHDGIRLRPHHLVVLTRTSPPSSAIINLPKIRSVVADVEYPDGDDKLVLLRVQHEGA